MTTRRTLLVRTLASLRRRPGYAVVVILSLGVGLGVSLAAGGLAKRVLLDPLPLSDPDRVLVVHRSAGTEPRGGITYGAWGDIAASGVFEEAAAVLIPTFDAAVVLTEGPYAERVKGLRVTPAFFRVLGVRPVAGQGFTLDPFAGPEVIVSHDAWVSRWGRSPLVGSMLRVGGEPHRVVGVLPPGFRYETEPAAELFVAMHPDPELMANRDARILQVIGRSDRPASVPERLASLDADIRRLATSPDLPPIRAVPIREFFFGHLRRPLGFLAAAGALTLLVAVANLVLLGLARGEELRTATAIRVSLGAKAPHLLAAPAAEAVVLGAASAILALLVAQALVAGVAATAGGMPAGADRLRLDPWLLGATLLLAQVAAAAGALAASWRTRRASPDLLRGRTRMLDRGALRRWNGLVAGQTALVALLLAATALTGRSLARLLEVDPGFEPSRAWALRFELPPDRYDTQPRIASLLRQVEEAVEATPAAARAGVVTNLPLTPGWGGELSVLDGETGAGPVEWVDWEMASPGYFDAMGIQVLEGRAFRTTDDADAPMVALVNRTLARRHWPEGGAVGARISGTGPAGPWLEVVGVVGDVRQEGLRRDVEPMMYVPHAQFFPNPSGELVVRAAPGAPGDVAAGAARAALLELEPRAVVGEVRALDALVRDDSADLRLQGLLLAIFAGASLLLGLAGVFGVVGYAVSRRAREMGIRMAVGATSAGIAGHVVGRGLVPVAVGTGVGMAASLLLGGQFRHLLYDTSPGDPLVLLGLPPLLLLAAALALLPPAVRAARTDPARVLSAD